MLGAQHRSRARHLVEHLRSLREEGEEPLHYHASGSWHPLEPKLKVSHFRAKAASHLADHVAKNWPAKQKRLLHAKASNEHGRTAAELHDVGFHHLAAQHRQWQDYHAAHANQTEDQDPRLVRHGTTGGHARSGHTLPQPSAVRAGDVPTTAKSAQRAAEDGTHWNERSGSYERVPKHVRKKMKRAEIVSKSVDRISYDRNFTDAERAHHNRAAAGHHVEVAQMLTTLGFHNQADDHMRRALKHVDRASDHEVARKEK